MATVIVASIIRLFSLCINLSQPQRQLPARTRQQIADSFKTEKFDEFLKQQNSELPYDERCAICLQDYQQEDIIVQLDCKHFYHHQCILPWTMTSKHLTCPICRQDIR